MTLQKKVYWLLILIVMTISFTACKQPQSAGELPLLTDNIIGPDIEESVDRGDRALYFNEATIELDLADKKNNPSKPLNSVRLYHGKDILPSALKIEVEDELIITAVASEDWGTVTIDPQNVGTTTITVTDTVTNSSSILTIKVINLDLIFEIRGFSSGAHKLILQKSHDDIAINTVITSFKRGTGITLPITVEGYDPDIIDAKIVTEDNDLIIEAKGRGNTSFYLQDANGIKTSAVSIDVEDIFVELVLDKKEIKVGETITLLTKIYGEDRNNYRTHYPVLQRYVALSPGMVESKSDERGEYILRTHTIKGVSPINNLYFEVVHSDSRLMNTPTLNRFYLSVVT